MHQDNLAMPPFILFKMIKLALLALLVWLLLQQRIAASNSAALSHLSALIGGSDSAQRISVLIAHPDDEVMFFSPALASMRQLPNVAFDVLCFSNGNAAGLGETRAAELRESVDLLFRGTEHTLRILNYTDGPHELWDTTAMARAIGETETGSAEPPSAILTFDSAGVSGHANHIACHEAARRFCTANSGVRLLSLDSHGGNIALKYSGVIPELARQLYRAALDTLRGCRWTKGYMPLAPVHPNTASTRTIRFTSTFPQYVLAYATMLNAHASQVVWFRYAWWVFSRFVYVNDIVVDPAFS